MSNSKSFTWNSLKFCVFYLLQVNKHITYGTYKEEEVLDLKKISRVIRNRFLVTFLINSIFFISCQLLHGKLCFPKQKKILFYKLYA